MTGTWTGTLICTANCPTGGATTGTITMVLTQDDTTGAVTGTYTTSGLLNFVSGSTVPDINDFISGASWQDKLADQDGRNFSIAGGPFEATLNTTGVAQDRTFQGFIVEGIPIRVRDCSAGNYIHRQHEPLILRRTPCPLSLKSVNRRRSRGAFSIYAATHQAVGDTKTNPRCTVWKRVALPP